MAKQYNVNIVGNLTNDNGVLSGFSVNDYATLPETLENLTINSLEIVFKFKTNSLTSNNAIFWTDKLIDDPNIPWAGLRLCNYNADNYVFDLEVTDNNVQVADIYDITAIVPNTYYYIKALYNDTDGYSLYKSEDGNNYTLIGTNATTTMPPNSQALIGRAVDTDPIPFDGSIDLNESYIKVNGVIWWKGAENITKIQLRHDTAANWTSVNPVLLEGEVGIETDTRKQKFGNGVTAWNSLPYDKGSTALQSITSSDVTTALGYTPVNKSGDTMTGSLRVNGLIQGTGGEDLINNALSKGTNPASASYWGIRMTDGDSSHTTWQSNRFGIIESSVMTDGSTKIQIATYKNEANSTYTASMNLMMSASGVPSCTFPNTTCCDGQWVNSSVQLANNVSLPVGNDQEITYDLSSAIPNDNYKYEVVLNYGVQTGNSSGAGLSANIIGSGDGIWHRICDTYARGSWYMVVGGNVVVTVGTARTVKFHYTTVSKAGQLNYLFVEGYKRKGTNA